jgi:hypothetical protein
MNERGNKTVTDPYLADADIDGEIEFIDGD